MGRTKKYQTEEEKIHIKRERAKTYYWNNKEIQDMKSRERYYNKKKLQ